MWWYGMIRWIWWWFRRNYRNQGQNGKVTDQLIGYRRGNSLVTSRSMVEIEYVIDQRVESCVCVPMWTHGWWSKSVTLGTIWTLGSWSKSNTHFPLFSLYLDVLGGPNLPIFIFIISLISLLSSMVVQAQGGERKKKFKVWCPKWPLMLKHLPLILFLVMRASLLWF